jgi:hypothetical protein
MQGDSSLEALCAALSLGLSLVNGVREKGGRLLTAVGGEDYPLELLAFGVAADQAAKAALIRDYEAGQPDPGSEGQKSG